MGVCGYMQPWSWLTSGMPDCPKGMLPVRDPTTGGWKIMERRQFAPDCYECTPVIVRDPATGKTREWKGIDRPYAIPYAINVITGSSFPVSPEQPGMPWWVIPAVGAVIVLSLMSFGGRR